MSGPEKERPKVAATTLGQPKTVEANGSPFFAHAWETCKQGCGASRWRASGSWRYGDRRGRALRVSPSGSDALLIQRENRGTAI